MGRRKVQGVVGNTILTSFEDGGRSGRRHGCERVTQSESKAVCLACSPGTTRETWNVGRYVSSRIVP